MKSLRPIVIASSITLFLMLCATSTAFSYTPPGNNGVGLAVGAPGGITFYHKIDESRFVQAYVSHYFSVGADYAVTFPNAISTMHELTPYIGGGAFFYSGYYWPYYDHQYSGIGVRMPFGILWQIPNAPVHVHLEIAPASTIIPYIYSFAEISLGARFLF